MIHFFNETINGLTQIRIYKQKLNKMQQFSENINSITKSGIAYEMMMRGFGFFDSFILMLLLVLGMYLGVAFTSPNQSGLFAITILYLVSICELFQWTLKQIIATEGIMVSAERMRKLETK